MNEPLLPHSAEATDLHALIQWGADNMTHPALLDLVACHLVSKALGAARGVRNPDGDWVIQADRATVGVFTAQAPQASESSKVPRLSFTIPNHFQWDDHSNYDLEYSPTNVYVFAIFTSLETGSLILTDLNQWTFYVLGFKRLEGWSPVTKSVSLQSVLNSGAIHIDLDNLADIIETINHEQWSGDRDEGS